MKLLQLQNGWGWTRAAVLAVTLVSVSAELASARSALVISTVNLRQGPGTNFGITTKVPGGAVVEVSSCSVEWCTIHWNGRVGYAIARNLDLGGVAGVAPPAPIVVDPGPVVVVGPRPYYWGGPRYYGGPGWRGGWRRW